MSAQKSPIPGQRADAEPEIASQPPTWNNAIKAMFTPLEEPS
jgi:hypothetical protein